MIYPYQIYCMGNMLFSKIWTYLTYDKIIKYRNVERIYDMDKGLLNSLYDLTYDCTKITDRIYLGNAYNARDYYNLESKDIGLIINCTEEIPNYFEEYFEYNKIIIDDNNEENMGPYFDEYADIIYNYIQNNNKNILIHCFMGSSRSATILLAYLIKYENYTLKKSLEYIKELRNIVNPNTSFYEQLDKRFTNNDTKNIKKV
jgi:dual specificity phosphatase 12